MKLTLPILDVGKTAFLLGQQWGGLFGFQKASSVAAIITDPSHDTVEQKRPKARSEIALEWKACGSRRMGLSLSWGLCLDRATQPDS